MWNPFRKLKSEGLTLIIRIVRTLLLALIALMPVWFLLTTAPGDVLVTNKQALLYGTVFVALVLWLALVVRRGRLDLRLTGLEIGIGIWLGAWLLGTIFSADPLRSLIAGNGWLTLAALALMVLVFANFFESRDVPSIINWFLLGSLAAIASGLLALFGLPAFGWLTIFSKALTVGDQFNTVGSFNVLAALAALALILAVVKLLVLGSAFDASRPGFWRAITIAAAIASAILLLAVNWWAHYLVAAAGMLATVITPRLTEKLSGVKVRLGAANIVIPLTIAATALLLAGASNYLDFRLPLSARVPPEVSLSQRGSLTIARQAVKERPVFGWGLGNFPLAYDKYKPAGINDSVFWNVRFNNAASEVWQALTAGGVLGLAALAALAVYLVKGMLASLRRGVANREIYGLAVLPALAAVLTLAALYPLSNPVLLFSFWLVVAMSGLGAPMPILPDVEAAEPDIGRPSAEVAPRVEPPSQCRDYNFGGGTGDSQHRATSAPGRWDAALNDSSLKSVLISFVLVLVVIASLAGGYLLLRKYQSEYYFAQAGRINVDSPEKAEQVTRLLVKAANAGGRETAYLNGLGQLLLNRFAVELNNRADKPEEVTARLQTLSQNIVTVTSQMAADYKNDAVAWSNAGFIYQNLIGLIDGADQAALNAYREVLKHAPADSLSQTRIGLIFLTRAEQNRAVLAEAGRRGQTVQNRKEVENLIAGDYKNAEEGLKRAIEMKRDLAAALYNLGVVYERQNRIKDAVKQLELVRDREAGNPGLAFELGLLYYRDNQKQNAFNEMARAVALFKDFSNARWYLALMLEEAGQMDDAIAQLKEILKLEVNKDNQVVKDKLAALEAGKREIPPAKVTSKKPLEASEPKQR